MTDGERWAADELLALRAAGFRPAAWWRLLSASWRRAAEIHNSQPELTRQAHAWSMTGLVGGLGTRALARRLDLPAPGRSAWATWWLATAAMLDLHLGMLEGPNGEPRERLTSADALTLTRVGLVPFIAATSDPAPRRRSAFSALIATGAGTDLLDGALARRTGTTRLGRDLDTVADVLSGVAAVRAARRAGWMTPATAGLATVRHAVPIVVVAASYFRSGHPPAHDAFGDTRWTAPILIAGLVVGPAAPRVGDALIRAGSLLSFTMALTRRRARGGKEHDLDEAVLRQATLT